LLQLEVPLAAVCDVAVRARRLGARVVLNAAPACKLPDALMSALDVLIVNEHEAATLAAGFGVSSEPEAFATVIHDRHGCAVIVTLGERGALAAADANVLFAAAPEVEVVDTTGAGDAFTGALAAALDRRAGWPRALAEGVAAGSLACRNAGAQAALPVAAAIDRLAATVQSSLVSHPVE
jgi:ribokinase